MVNKDFQNLRLHERKCYEINIANISSKILFVFTIRAQTVR